MPSAQKSVITILFVFKGAKESLAEEEETRRALEQRNRKLEGENQSLRRDVLDLESSIQKVNNQTNSNLKIRTNVFNLENM